MLVEPSWGQRGCLHLQAPSCGGSVQAFRESTSVSSSCHHQSHGQWGLNNKNVSTHRFGAQPSEIPV